MLWWCISIKWQGKFCSWMNAQAIFFTVWKTWCLSSVLLNCLSNNQLLSLNDVSLFWYWLTKKLFSEWQRVTLHQAVHSKALWPVFIRGKFWSKAWIKVRFLSREINWALHKWTHRSQMDDTISTRKTLLMILSLWVWALSDLIRWKEVIVRISQHRKWGHEMSFFTSNLWEISSWCWCLDC